MFLLILRLLARLPLTVLHGVGAFAGVLSFALQPGVRAKARGNLTAAGLYSRRLAWRSAAEAGKAVFETPYLWFRPLAWLRARTDTSALDQAIAEHLASAAATGTGTVFLTPHLGAFELSSRLFEPATPITVLYKPPRRADLHEILKVARRSDYLSAVPTDAGGIRALLRALRRGEAIGVLPDQVPMAGEGVWAPFFGRSAFTMTLPARLVERSGGSGVFLIATRRRRLARGWDVEVKRLDGIPTPARINAAIEQMIRSAPDQYYWDYNRYKAPGGVEPPPVLEGAGS